MIEPKIAMKKDVLESWLKVSGYTKSRLAEELSISRSRISQILKSNENPSSRLIAGLLTITKLPFERLFVLNGGRRGRNGGR
jgi:transcriptional regulator with XRE-family HTH domain